MTFLAIEVPIDDRGRLAFVVGQTNLFGARFERGRGLPGLAHTREVAFDICGKHRHACARKSFSEDLQCYRLAGPCCPGH